MSPKRNERVAVFLRAINVGGHTVKMDALRAMLAQAGLSGVETIIASGNVIVDHPGGRVALDKRIATALEEELGYAVATFVRTREELEHAISTQPFGAPPKGGDVCVAFFSAPPSDTGWAKANALCTANDSLARDGNHVYWLRRARSMESIAFGGKIERALGAPCTIRTIGTVVKIAAKLGA